MFNLAPRNLNDLKLFIYYVNLYDVLVLRQHFFLNNALSDNFFLGMSGSNTHTL